MDEAVLPSPCRCGGRAVVVETIGPNKGGTRLGVIDALGAGFSTINKKLALVLIPIVLDLFFWLGPRLSVPAFHVGSPLNGLPADSQSMLEQFEQSVNALTQGFNGFTLLGIGVPNLLGSNTDPTSLLGTTVIEVHGKVLFAGLMVAIAIFGLFLTSLYLTLIAQVVRDGRLRWRRLYRVLVYWGRLLLLMLVIGVVAVAIILPFAVVSMLAAQASTGLWVFMAFLLQGPMYMLLLIFIFAAMAIFVDDARPLVAISRSMAVLTRSFWSSLGLLVLVATVFLGFPYVWQAIMRNPYGVVLAILGNAYIGTAFATAIMLFYRDRAAQLVKRAKPPA